MPRKKKEYKHRIPLTATNEEAAILKRSKDQKMRICLKCNGSFLSSGKTHRICKTCSENNLRIGKREGQAFPGAHHRSKRLS